MQKEISLEKKEERKQMEDAFKVIEDYLMIKMPEELDHHKSVYIRKKVDYLIMNQEIKNVVFDFEDTRFMDSSGIGVIMGRYKMVQCFGGRIYAIHPDMQIKRILRMSGLNKMIEIME